jgi:lysozyme
MYTLKNGDRGQEVKRLQTRLIDEGSAIKADGIFGPATAVAVTNFQKKIGEAPTGAASANTLAKLGIPVLAGIDVSHHNGEVSWTAETNTPAFCYIKATEGRTHKDTRFHDAGSLCLSLGVPFGFYHFARPDTDSGPTDAVREANLFCDTIGNMDATLRPVVDMEKGVKTDDQYNTDWTLAFCDRVNTLLGATPIVYTAQWYWDAYYRDSTPGSLAELRKLDLWLASYNEGSHPSRTIPGWEWLIWQHTGSGSATGIRGKVDQNWLAGGQFQQLL